MAVFYGSELWSNAGRSIVSRLGSAVHCGVAISQYTAAEAVRAGFPDDRLRVVPLGADEPRLPADSIDRIDQLGLQAGRYLVTVSRLVEPHKGHEAMLRLLPALACRHPEMRYVIAGDGPLGQRLRCVSEAHHSEPFAVWTGPVDEDTKNALMAHSRAFVMVTREARAAGAYEGFGLTYLEAGALGRPSLAGRSGGVPDAVVHEKTGLLVDPDDPVAIIDSADRLLQDSQYADRLGEGARAHAAGFTWGACVDRFDEALREMLRE